MKKIMLMALALSFNALSAQEFDDHQHDNQQDNQEIEAISAAENAEDVGPNDVAVEQEKKQQDVAQFENNDVECNHDPENEIEE